MMKDEMVYLGHMPDYASRAIYKIQDIDRHEYDVDENLRLALVHYGESDPEYIRKFFRHTDENGRRYRIDNLASPSDRPNLKYEYKGYKPPKNDWAISKEKMEQWDKEERLHFPNKPDGRIQRKRYLDELKGQPIQNIWTDISPIGSQSKERLGYPTQKPIALLERVIETSSNAGDIVMDPFCGCGTAIAAAEKLGRKWIGIDITYLAVALIKKRLLDHFPDVKYEENGELKSVDDARQLFNQSPFQFESWAVSLLGGQPYKSKGGADRGIDGLLYFQNFEGKHYRIIIEVKSGSYQPKDVRSLKSVLDREQAPLGVLISLRLPTKGMIAEAASFGRWKLPDGIVEYLVLQIFTIDDYFSGKRVMLPDTSGTL